MTSRKLRPSAEVGEAVPGVVLGIDSWILGVTHPGFDLGGEFGFGGGLRGIGGEVLDLIGIAAEVVEFLGGAFGEVEVKEALHGSFTLIEDELLGLRGIDITKRSDGEVQYGIARRPAVGAQVADVKEVRVAHGAAGVASIAAAHVGMAFAFEEDLSAVFAIALTGEHVEKTARGHFGPRFDIGEFEEGGGEIG